MLAIKNWFLEKEQIRGLWGKELKAIKETDKAIYVEWEGDMFTHKQWFPKSCLCDEWEKWVTPLAYHEYLLDLCYEAYRNKVIENYSIDNGYGYKYRGDAFYHQMKSAELKKMLEKHNIEYMTFKEWRNR